MKTYLWRFDLAVDGKPSGVLLKIEPSPHRAYRQRIYYRLEGIRPKKMWVEDIPENSIIWVTSNVLPGLGNNRIAILTTGGDGKSPIGEHLKVFSGQLSLQLAYAKEREEAALASKNVEVMESRKTTDEMVDKHIKTLEKIEGASRTPYWKRRESEDLMR